MSRIPIKRAPFTDFEKRQILKMGIVEAEWGHPQVKLKDPIRYFREELKKGSKDLGIRTFSLAPGASSVKNKLIVPKPVRRVFRGSSEEEI